MAQDQRLMQCQASPQQHPMRPPLTQQQEKIYVANLPDRHPIPAFENPDQDSLDIATQEYLELEHAAWDYALSHVAETIAVDTQVDTEASHGAPASSSIAPAKSPAATMAEQQAGTTTVATAAEAPNAPMAEQTAGNTAVAPTDAKPVDPAPADATMAEQTAGNTAVAPTEAKSVETAPADATMAENAAGNTTPAAPVEPPPTDPDATMAKKAAETTAVAPTDAKPVEPDATMAGPAAGTTAAKAPVPPPMEASPAKVPVALKQSLAVSKPKATPKASTEPEAIKFAPVTPAAAKAWMALMKRSSTDDLSIASSPAPTALLTPKTPPPKPISFAQQLMKMDDVQLATKLSCAEAHPQWDEFSQGVDPYAIQGDTLKTLLAFELWLQSGNARVANTIVPTPQTTVLDALPKVGKSPSPSPSPSMPPPPVPTHAAPSVAATGTDSPTSAAPTDEGDAADKKAARATYMRYYRSVRGPKVPSAVAIKFREAMADVTGQKGRELFEAYIESGENWLSSSIVLSDSQSHDETEGGRWNWLTRDESRLSH